MGTREREHRDLLKALGSERFAPEAIWALGFAGTREAADACVELLCQGRHAQLAFEGFCAVTGVDLKANRLAIPAPEGNPPAPVSFEQDDLNADLVPKVEADLPLPDGAAVARWWAQNRSHFAPDTRYLLGKPTDPAVLRRVLCEGPMRRRHVLALDLAIQTRGQQQLNTRALCREQRRSLAT